MDITVLGWYGHGNLGDDAFELAIPPLCPEGSFRFTDQLTDDPADLYILGGGDVVYSPYTSQLIDRTDAPKIALSVTLTSLSDLAGLADFRHVYVRDLRSLAIADSAHIPCSYLPDATFGLTPDPRAGRAWLERTFRSAGLVLASRVIVCVISAYIAFNQGDSLARDQVGFLKLATDLMGVLDMPDVSLVFLPFSTWAPWDDRMSNAWVAGKSCYYDKNYVVYDHLSVQQTLDIIAASNAVVSTRLHSTIFSVISGVPFVDITHHDKNRGFIELINQPWSISFWEFDVDRFRRLIRKFLSESLPNVELVNFSQKSKMELNVSLF